MPWKQDYTISDEIGIKDADVRWPDGTPPLANDRLRRMLGRERGEPPGGDPLPPMRRLDGTPYPAGETPIARALRGEIVHGEELLYGRDDDKAKALRGGARSLAKVAARAVRR